MNCGAGFSFIKTYYPAVLAKEERMWCVLSYRICNVYIASDQFKCGEGD